MAFTVRAAGRVLAAISERRKIAWIAKRCKPPLAPRCANVCQSSAFFCHSVAGLISLPLPKPEVASIPNVHTG